MVTADSLYQNDSRQAGHRTLIGGRGVNVEGRTRSGGLPDVVHIRLKVDKHVAVLLVLDPDCTRKDAVGKLAAPPSHRSLLFDHDELNEQFRRTT